MTGDIGQEFGKRVIQNILDIFITPEIKRRQDAGKLPKPVKLSFAQVILFPDERKHLVRINEEVRAKAKIKYKPGISKKPGEPVYENEIEEIEHVELGPEDDPDCGHIFLYFQGSNAFLSFDFRRNRDLALNHIRRAKEYFGIARYSLQQSNLATFIDNLFNAAELCAKATLLVMYDYPPALRTRASHRGIHMRYNRYANLGNVLPAYKKTFNKLACLRDPARYLKGELPTIPNAEAQEMLGIIDKMIRDAERRCSNSLLGHAADPL